MRASKILKASALSAAMCLYGSVVLAASADCPKCDEWSEPQKPFKVYGNTYYVGTRELSSILITSESGHVLIDGTVDEAAAQIAAHIEELGFKVKDVKLILNSHNHYDHAGGIAQLQKLSGAKVAASPSSAQALSTGHYGRDDPLFGTIRELTPVGSVSSIPMGKTLSVGPLKMTAHFTPGHTPGGTSWTWQSCEKQRCLNLVYADSLSAVSADGFRFSRSTAYPTAVKDFNHSFDVLNSLPCDVLLTPHPEISDVLGRLERREKGNADAFIDATACQTYAATFKKMFKERLAEESSSAGAN